MVALLCLVPVSALLGVYLLLKFDACFHLLLSEPAHVKLSGICFVLVSGLFAHELVERSVASDVVQ